MGNVKSLSGMIMSETGPTVGMYSYHPSRKIEDVGGSIPEPPVLIFAKTGMKPSFVTRHVSSHPDFSIECIHFKVNVASGRSIMLR
jgi:hypothetical protein